jgi:hypothetical protein
VRCIGVGEGHYSGAEAQNPCDQFTRIDPIGLAGGLGLYAFANGDPVNYVDADGLSATRLPAVNVTAERDLAHRHERVRHRLSDLLQGAREGQVVSNEHSGLMGTCRSDLMQVGVNVGMNATGIAALRYLRSLWRTLRGADIAVSQSISMTTAESQLVRNAALLPPGLALSVGGRDGRGGSRPEFGGTGNLVWNGLKWMPVLGVGFDSYEATGSCLAALESGLPGGGGGR